MLVDIGMMVAVYALWRFLNELLHLGAGGANADLGFQTKAVLVLATLVSAGVVLLFAVDLLAHSTTGSAALPTP